MIKIILKRCMNIKCKIILIEIFLLIVLFFFLFFIMNIRLMILIINNLRWYLMLLNFELYKYEI